MQRLFLDVTAEQLRRNPILRESFSEADLSQPYVRLSLSAETKAQLEQKLVQILIAESVQWVLLHERAGLPFLKDPQDIQVVRMGVTKRLEAMLPQVTLLVDRDLERLNLEGYLRFSAKKLKWLVQTLVQEEYAALREEQERQDFISLLQFCVDVQPSLLDHAYLTLTEDSFILLDQWGNDLCQLYLDSLPKEEYQNVERNDLVLSILMTLLPNQIHVSAIEKEQEAFVALLQKIFGERVCIKG